MNMPQPNPLDVQRIADFYRVGIARFGAHTAQAVGWRSAQRVLKGYEILTQAVGQDWRSIESVLDVGSGQGHLLAFLRRLRGFEGRFVGIELLPEFHALALQDYGAEPGAEFMCAEFTAHAFGEEQFDWVFSYGSLSVAQPRQREFDQAVIDKMAALAKRGFSLYVNDVNKMSSIPPGLAAHDMTVLRGDLAACAPGADINVVPFPATDSYTTVVHVTRLPEPPVLQTLVKTLANKKECF
jgi:SAM-dependent methyltransferase